MITRHQHRLRKMHLMYYLDEDGKRVYTLKVRACRLVEPTGWVPTDDSGDAVRIMA